MDEKTKGITKGIFRRYIFYTKNEDWESRFPKLT